VPYSYPEIRTFRGLYLQKNSFTVPDGAMELARNCILFQDNRASKTRGFYEYFDPVSGTLNNLFFYQDKLLAIYLNKLVYYTDTGVVPNQTGVESTLTGASIVITSPRTSRSVQASNNLYFTTDNGVMKIDAYNGKIFEAGMPPGLDISAILLADNGWFVGDSQVAVRVLFGRRDANANLLLGAPSEQLVLTNSPVVNVAYTVSGGGPYTITVTSPSHNLATGMTISVTASTGSPVVPVADYTVTVTNLNVFTFEVVGSAPGAGNLTYEVSRVIQLEFTIPSDITTAADNYFFQYYRTSTSLSSSVTPTPNYRLVEERILTAAEITARRVFYTDDVDEVLVSSAPELYTNPNSREGELQANLKPPKCDDVALYKDCVLYAKCTTRHTIEVDLVDTSTLANGDYVEIKISATTRRYVARTGVGNTNVATSSLSYSTPTLTITYNSHGLLAGDTVYISNAVGTGTLPSGSYAISNVLTNSFDITQVGITGISYLEFEGVTVTGGFNMFTLDNTSSSISAQLRNTARGFVKAVNRDTSSLIYASYISGINDVPGKMGFQAKGFGEPMYFRANTTTAGSSFLPPLPDSFVSGNQVFSANEAKPNVIFSSKVGEPEAVPIVNEFVVGSRNAKIFRIFSLRDSVVILKADGVFRLTGDSPLNFSVTAIDNTLFCVAANSGAILNNQVYFLANQGVCIATESSTQILSREKIEDPIIPIVGKADIEVQTGSVAYESERTYKLSTIGPNDEVKVVSYIYNFVNDTWTTFDELFIQGVVGPKDTLYLISSANTVRKERKTQTRIDYCGQNYPVTVTAVAVDLMSATVTSSGVTPAEGDVILKNEVFNRIKTVTALGGSSYTLTFRTASNLAVSDSTILYQGYETEIDFSPFHAGQVGLMKQFAQMQIHTRTPSITRLEISFSGFSYGGSETTVWEVQNIRDGGNLGWGQFPWGFEPWGQADTIDIAQVTQPSPPIRIIVPLFQQRTTFIKARLKHREAGESMDIQALDYAVRPYKERVSR
jgi:hypothetical protein